MNAASINSQSYYAATANPHTDRPSLDQDIEADIAVIGAGFTGLSAALELAGRGYDVAVLESETVGWGASGRNGGQVCSAYSKSMDHVEGRIGRDAARIAWGIAEEAKALIAERVARHRIGCDLKWGYLHAATKPSHLEDVREMAAEFETYGNDRFEVLDTDAVRDRVGSERFVGAFLDRSAGHFHPLNYCLGLAEAAERAGARIYEHSAAVRLETDGSPSVRTDRATVRCRYLILAGNAYLGGLVPYLSRRIMPVKSYILATEPLAENRARGLIRHDEAVADLNFIVDYFRLSADRRLLFGGRASYTTLEPSDLFAFMRPRMLRVFPQLDDVRLDYCWGGYIGITVDRMPHLGRIGKSTYFAQGFSGHGVAISGMSGKLIADAIAGQAERFDVLARIKHPVFPGGRFRTPLLALGMLYYRMKDALG